MTDCEFCDKEFDSKQELYLHWGKEHRDELNSHQKDKVKKAERKAEENKEATMRQRRRLLGQGLAGGAALIVVALLAGQMFTNGGTSGTADQLSLEGQPSIGSENATVKVVAFEDYKCPYCRQFEEQIYPQLEEDYIDTGKVEFYFVNYAFLDLPDGRSSTRAAVAGECVYQQSEEEFWKFHSAVYDNQGQESTDWATKDVLMEIARENTQGIDYEELDSCITTEKTISDVRSDRTLGDNNGVRGTPTVFVNGNQVSNSLNYGNVRSIIEQQLK